MNDQVRLMARYQQLRRVAKDVNQTLMHRLPRGAMNEGGRELGILRGGILVFGSEEEMAVLGDFCIHDLRHQGRTAVEALLAEGHYRPGSDEEVFLRALQDARYSLFAVEAQEPGVGVRVRDLVRDETLRIHDVNFSRTAQPGVVMATRLAAPEGITMTTGAALPLGVLPSSGWGGPVREAVDLLSDRLLAAKTPEETSRARAFVIRFCLEAGGGEHMAYEEPGLSPGGRPAPPVGRYDPCPCGSGKKYKFCCGARR